MGLPISFMHNLMTKREKKLQIQFLKISKFGQPTWREVKSHVLCIVQGLLSLTKQCSGEQCLISE